MKILVLNASPKGGNSTTVHTALYLQALHPEHQFTVVPVGQRIKRYEKDFAPLRAELEQADLLCGYTTYIQLARAVCPDTPTLSTPMTKEIQRCRMAPYVRRHVRLKRAHHIDGKKRTANDSRFLASP